MKILSNKQYNLLKGLEEEQINDYESKITSLMVDNKDYELRINKIRDKLYDIINTSKNNASKDDIYKKINGIIDYIEKGR